MTPTPTQSTWDSHILSISESSLFTSPHHKETGFSFFNEDYLMISYFGDPIYLNQLYPRKHFNLVLSILNGLVIFYVHVSLFTSLHHHNEIVDVAFLNEDYLLMSEILFI